MATRALVAALVLVALGGLAGTALALKSSSSFPPVEADCSNPVPGHGFRVFTCMSGGAAAGDPHPKELLVVRSDGSSIGYPVWRTAALATGDGEVVATHDLSLVRVTRARLIPLLTQQALASALHVGREAIQDILAPRVDARGDVYFVASALRPDHAGCENPFLELGAGGAVRRVRPSQTAVCS